jgi:hypothetical protein
VVDDELRGDQRVDGGRVGVELVDHGVAHRGEIDDRGDAGEVLHDDARRRERDLAGRLGLGVPPRQRLDVLLGDGAVALRPQQVLEQDLQREGQTRDVEPRLQGVQPEDLEGAVADLQVGPSVERVRVGHGWEATTI